MENAMTPKIPMAEIKEFLKRSKSEKDDSRRCRQIIGQLLQERNDFADKLLNSCVIPVGEQIITEGSQKILFKDSEEYDAIVAIGQRTMKEEELEKHYWLDGQYDGYDKPNEDRQLPEKDTAEHPPYSPPSSPEKGDGGV